MIVTRARIAVALLVASTAAPPAAAAHLPAAEATDAPRAAPTSPGGGESSPAGGGGGLSTADTIRFALAREGRFTIPVPGPTAYVVLVVPGGSRVELSPRARAAELQLAADPVGGSAAWTDLPAELNAGCSSPREIGLIVTRVGPEGAPALESPLRAGLEEDAGVILWPSPGDTPGEGDPALLLDVEKTDHPCDRCDSRPMDDCLVGTWELRRSDLPDLVGLYGTGECGRAEEGEPSWSGSFRLEIGPEGRVSTHYDALTGRAFHAGDHVENVFRGMASTCAEGGPSALGGSRLDTDDFEWRVEVVRTERCASAGFHTRTEVETHEDENAIVPAVTTWLVADPRYTCSARSLTIKDRLHFRRVAEADRRGSRGTEAVGRLHLRVETRATDTEQGLAPVGEAGAGAVEDAEREMAREVESLPRRAETLLAGRYPGRDVSVDVSHSAETHVEQTDVITESTSTGKGEAVVTFYEYEARTVADVTVEYRVGRFGR